jgi:light-regulated signal transduction histidine kinase (bacteriophytochrome)
MVWVLDKAVQIQISPNEPLYSMGVWQDITEQKLFSQQLIEKADELKRSNIDLQQFAYAVSHDLQEPLRTINTYIQLFQKRYPNQLDAEATEFMQFVVEGAHRMKKMIDDLLEYSRVSTLSHAHALTDCNQVFQQQLLYLLPSYEKNEARITCDELPTLIVDQVQIGQLFRNLLSNALKYRSAKPPCIHISAKRIATPSHKNGKVTSSWVNKADDTWLFAIRDNGIGIAPEFHERIFQIFQRLHTREEYPGTGIGLALCKRIVERHGGCIWVDSQFGAGSTFYFTLPAIEVDEIHPHVHH